MNALILVEILGEAATYVPYNYLISLCDDTDTSSREDYLY